MDQNKGLEEDDLLRAVTLQAIHKMDSFEDIFRELDRDESGNYAFV